MLSELSFEGVVATFNSTAVWWLLPRDVNNLDLITLADVLYFYIYTAVGGRHYAASK